MSIVIPRRTFCSYNYSMQHFVGRISLHNANTNIIIAALTPESFETVYIISMESLYWLRVPLAKDVL